MRHPPKKRLRTAPRSYRGMAGTPFLQAIKEDFGDKVMLSFSRGKDALGSYLAMREVYCPSNIIPYYLYIVPGLLSFERESLEYFEQEVFGKPIITLPHPGLYRMLGDCLLQPPERVPVIQAANLPRFDFGVIRTAVREIGALPLESVVASGIRAVDSPVRRMSIEKTGPFSRAQDQFYPIWDWKKARLVAEIKKSGIKLPEDYHLFGRTFDGLDMRFMIPLKRHKPADYQRILEWYPFADMHVWLMEKRGLI